MSDTPPKAEVNLEHWQLRYGIANKISRGTFSATFLLASRLTLTLCGCAGRRFATTAKRSRAFRPPPLEPHPVSILHQLRGVLASIRAPAGQRPPRQSASGAGSNCEATRFASVRS
jgi:hypothetical protein